MNYENYAVIVDTQVLENYGDASKPHWKAKGGNTIWTFNVTSKKVPDETQILNSGLPELSHIECRNSAMYIEFITKIEFISVYEAEIRSKINLADPSLTSEQFFNSIRKLEIINQYSLGD